MQTRSRPVAELKSEYARLLALYYQIGDKLADLSGELARAGVVESQTSEEPMASEITLKS